MGGAGPFMQGTENQSRQGLPMMQSKKKMTSAIRKTARQPSHPDAPEGRRGQFSGRQPQFSRSGQSEQFIRNPSHTDLYAREGGQMNGPRRTEGTAGAGEWNWE